MTLPDTPNAQHDRKHFRRVAAGLIGVGVVGFILLVVFRQQPVVVPPPPRVPVVTVVDLEEQSGTLSIRGNGTVRPTAQVSLSSEVSGRVVWVRSSLVSGGRFHRGDVLLRIDSADYHNAVEAAQADVAARRVDVLQAEQEVEIAREEYRRLRQHEGTQAPPDSTAIGSLVFREPQLRAAEAAWRGAQSRLDDAQLALERTALRAPFDGIVRNETVDVGQYVTPGMGLATIYASLEVEVVVPLSPDRAALIENLWQATPGSRAIPATVYADVASIRYEWTGYVDRAEAALDERTRTVNVVVKVEGAFDTRQGSAGDESSNGFPRLPSGRRPPLVLGTYVDVDITAIELDQFYTIPRAALRDGNVIWIVENDTLLVMRSVLPIQEVEGTVQLLGDLPAGAQVVVSDLPVIVDSMTVRVLAERGEG